MTFRTVDKSQTLLLNEQSRNLEKDGMEVIKFGFGQSPFSPPKEVVDVHRQSVGQHFYSAVQGMPELREAVAQFHHAVDGVKILPENILIAPGSKMLIYAMIGAFEKVDVLIPAPAWVSYAPQAALWNQRAIRIEGTFETRWNITPETLEAAIAKKADAEIPSLMILNYPGNPTGTSYREEELQAIAETCRKHQIYVISDEIYGLLHHKGEHRSIMHLYPERTVITTGLSKWCGAGGWRVGAALLSEQLPVEIKEVMLGIASETYSCNGTPAQYAAIRAYQYDETIRHFVATERKILQAVGNEVAARLQQAGIAVHAPEGGFYLMPDFSPFREALSQQGVASSEALCTKLLADTGVALLPGDAFGLEPDILAARLAYVDFDGSAAIAACEALPDGAEIDAAFMQQYMPKVLLGTEKIVAWTAALTGARKSA